VLEEARLRFRRRQMTRARTTRDYWERRSQYLGERAVISVNHSEISLGEVTERQKGRLFPLLQQITNGNGGTILDLGCGAGRFTPDLAELIGGRAIGADITGALLKLAPEHPDVEYRHMAEGIIPIPDASVDAAWIVGVLMCITDDALLSRTLNELDRVLRPRSPVLLVEATVDRPVGRYHAFRSEDAYVDMFPGYSMAAIDRYTDADDLFSVLAGMKPSS
jgi:ubiquinone/menaquinone biosynthesis C-methylase UbiE